jgi:hypothetical protein
MGLSISFGTTNCISKLVVTKKAAPVMSASFHAGHFGFGAAGGAGRFRYALRGMSRYPC